MAREGRTDWGVPKNTDSAYDLVIVGAGISGLSAAHYYLERYSTARILILDNHDDFGGHCKRNEFQVGDRTLIGYGGAQTMEEPSSYSRLVKRLLKELGVNLKAFDKAYDQNFYRKHGLGGGLHFDQQHWGQNKVIRYDLGSIASFLPVADSELSAADAVAAMPISDAARQQMLGLLQERKDQFPKLNRTETWEYLQSISYRSYLSDHLGISEPDVFKILQDMFADSGLGIEAATAAGALSYAGLPGWRAAGFKGNNGGEPYIHHFPDGNASIARLLVKRLIPEVAVESGAEDLIGARFDYGVLDEPDSAVRLRLNSTAVHVESTGKPGSNSPVDITYVTSGITGRVSARHCILACNNSAIPYLCPELPEAQKSALSEQVKIPILYTNVVLNNWRAWKNLGLAAVISPTGYHINCMLDFPVSMGGYEFSADPDEPIIVHMERFPHRSNQGLTAKQQYRFGRHELLSTSFEDIELRVREQLTGVLGDGGFDPARDIEAITVNRWAHGYSSWYNPLFETVYDDYDDPRYPHIRARQPFGSITIANADSAADAILYAAIEQAHRAVEELS